MELNRENIIKTLDQFHHRILNTNLAEKITEQEMLAMIDALALINSQEQRIKELTEENEYLKQQNEIYAVLNEKMEHICESYAFQYGTAVPKEVFLKKERERTIREMQERVKEAPIKVGLPLFGLQTKDEVEDYANGLILQMRDAIDQIAKEMLEGENEN